MKSFELFLTSSAFKARNKKRLKECAVIAKNRMDKYVPMDEGTLKNASYVLQMGQYYGVSYIMPYAKRQYYENKGSGLRGGFWDNRMLEAEEIDFYKECYEVFKKVF